MTEADDHHRGDASDGDPPLISARDLTLNGARGRVYGPDTFDVFPYEVTVFQGPPGSGRTSRLLTLTGRMRQSAGEVTIFGLPYPNKSGKIRRLTAIAGFAGIDELDESVKVGEAIRERLGWIAPWYRRVPRVSDATVSDICAPVWGDRELPSAKTVIWELTQLDQMLLRVAIAQMSKPYLLAIDDFEQLESAGDRIFFAERLCAIAPSCTVITTAANRVDGPPGVRHLELGTASPQTQAAP